MLQVHDSALHPVSSAVSNINICIVSMHLKANNCNWKTKIANNCTIIPSKTHNKQIPARNHTYQGVAAKLAG